MSLAQNLVVVAAAAFALLRGIVVWEDYRRARRRERERQEIRRLIGISPWWGRR